MQHLWYNLIDSFAQQNEEAFFMQDAPGDGWETLCEKTANERYININATNLFFDRLKPKFDGVF